MKLLSSFVLVSIALAPVGADTLWDNAVSIFEENRDLLPGRIEVRLTEYGGRNRRVRNEEHGVYLTTPAPDGEPDVEIERVIRNGEDITEERRADNDGGGFESLFGPPQSSDIPEGEEREDGTGGPGESSPFDPDLQHLVTYERNGESRLVNGRRTTAFTFRQRNEDDPDQSVTGTAWLDARSGAPLLLESTFDPLPSRLLDTFVFRSHFTETGDGWYLTRLDVDVIAQILLVRREFESVITFSDHFRN